MDDDGDASPVSPDPEDAEAGEGAEDAEPEPEADVQPEVAQKKIKEDDPTTWRGTSSCPTAWPPSLCLSVFLQGLWGVMIRQRA